MTFTRKSRLIALVTLPLLIAGTLGVGVCVGASLQPESMRYYTLGHWSPPLVATSPLALDEVGYDMQGASANSAINAAANIKIAVAMLTAGDTADAIEHLGQAHSDARMAYRMLGATTDAEAERIGRLLEISGVRRGQ